MKIIKNILVVITFILGMLFLGIRLLANFLFSLVFNKKSEVEEINEIIESHLNNQKENEWLLKF